MKKYISCLTKHGLLDEMRADAMHQGDGARLYALRKYDFPKLITNNHNNYKILHFEMVAQLEATLPKRLAHSILNNRTVNMRGGEGHNSSNDLAMEMYNKGKILQELSLSPICENLCFY